MKPPKVKYELFDLVKPNSRKKPKVTFLNILNFLLISFKKGFLFWKRSLQKYKKVIRVLLVKKFYMTTVMSDAPDTKIAATSIPIKHLLFTLLRFWTCLPLNGIIFSKLPQHQPIDTKFGHSRIFNGKITPNWFLLFLLLEVRFQYFLANLVF